jgi:hypothetical protein
MKIGFKFWSNLPMNELIEVSAARGKAAPAVEAIKPEVVVPVMQTLPVGSMAMARPMSPVAPKWAWPRMLVAVGSVLRRRTPSFWSSRR